MILDVSTYNKLLQRLNRLEDVDRVAKEFDLDREMVFVIYSQKTVRKATGDYYRVKNKSRKLYNDWKRGEDLVSIADRMRFPAVLTGLLIMQEHGWSKKRYRKVLHEPDQLKDERLKEELIAVCEADILYSPEGNRIQTDRGIVGEERMHDLLAAKGIDFLTEDELREETTGKTPDFLIKGSFRFKDQDIHWVESKASFGDRKEVSRNMKNQLEHYLDEHGPGMVVYWFGVASDVPRPKGILVETDDVESEM